MATDVASKGLDFPAIQHVINYDMPEEIENYGKAHGYWWAGQEEGQASGKSTRACSFPCSAQNWPHWAFRKHRHRYHLHQQGLR